MISAGEVDRNRLNYLLSQSLFVASTGGNDFAAFADGGMTMGEAPAYVAAMVATYVKRIKVMQVPASESKAHMYVRSARS